MCQSELPLRAHSAPKSATRLDGFGTSTVIRSTGVGDEVEVCAGEADNEAVVGADAGTDDPVVHAASRTPIEQRYGGRACPTHSLPRRTAFRSKATGSFGRPIHGLPRSMRFCGS